MAHPFARQNRWSESLRLVLLQCARTLISGLCWILFYSLASLAQISDAVYNQVTAAFQEGRLAEAERYLRSALGEHPQEARALSLLGIILDNQKRFEEAERSYKTALSIAPDSTALLNNLGNHYVARGLQAQGEAAFRRALAQDPKHANANLQMAKISITRKRGLEALRSLSRLPVSEQRSPAVQLLKAQSLRLTKQSAAAQAIMRDLEKQAASDSRLAFSLGMAFVEWEQFQDAERNFTLALRASPSDFDILYNLGLAAMRARSLDRAVEIFHAALQQRPQEVDALIGLARTHVQQKKHETAASLLAQAQKLSPQRNDILLLLAQCSEKLGFYQDAATAYEQYLKLKPDDDQARRERAFMLARAGKQREGLRDLEWYVQKNPKDTVGLYQLALAEWNVEPPKALQHLTKALEIDPTLLSARFARSVLRCEQNQPQESIEDLRYILKREPENARALDQLGQAYLLLEKSEEAVSALERAARLAPKDSSILIHYGRALRRLGKHSEGAQVLAQLKALVSESRRGVAPSGLLDYLSLTPEERRTRYLDNLQKRLASSPNDPALALQLGRALLAEGKREQGSGVLIKLAEITADVALLSECGGLLLDYQSYEAARTVLSRARNADPSATQVRLNLALAVFNIDGPGAALKELDQISPGHRNGDHLLLRAQVLDALDRPEEAAQTLNEALKAEPAHSELYFQAALFLIKYQKNIEALQVLEKAAQLDPNSPRLMIFKAILLEMLKRPEDAKQLFFQVQTRWPEWGLPYLLHGIVLQTHLFFEEARSMFETAIALGENDALAYYYLALATLNATPDDTETVNNAIVRAVQLSPDDPDILAFAGKQALRRKDYPAAIGHLTAALRVKPKMTEVHYALSAAYRGIGDPDKSKSELELAQKEEQQPQTEDSRTEAIRRLLFTVGRRNPTLR